MTSRARAPISRRRSSPGYLVREGCKEVCLMPLPLLWLPWKRDSAAEAGETQDIGRGQSLSQHWENKTKRVPQETALLSKAYGSVEGLTKCGGRTFFFFFLSHNIPEKVFSRYFWLVHNEAASLSIKYRQVPSLISAQKKATAD